jgi:hypothetical protein
MMQRKHSSEAMTGAPGALPCEAIRCLTLIVARHLSSPALSLSARTAAAPGSASANASGQSSPNS